MTFESPHSSSISREIEAFNQGDHLHAYRLLGAKPTEEFGQVGYRFRVWAPHAFQVYLQGDFSNWQLIPMERLSGGIWALFNAQAQAGQCYKYGIDHGNGHIEYKIDPFATEFERPPKDASILSSYTTFDWQDQTWLEQQSQINKFESPLQIYELHPGSWRRHPDGRFYTWEDLAESLIPYLREMSYSHVELMPVMDHPHEASWGYQITGYFAVSARYGDCQGLRHFINTAHQANIGVILDWVPGHFNRNANALAYYDGTATFESDDVTLADNPTWGTLNFDLSKGPVQSFLLSNLYYWIEEFHVDGIRVDAVSHILCKSLDQQPQGSIQDNLSFLKEDSLAFLRRMNQLLARDHPQVYRIAEESSALEGITTSPEDGGIGFDFKWNMGWMQDTLKFMSLDPLYRPASLRLLTFVFMYQFKERYILPLSHDEVVHGKRSLLGRMPGDRFSQFANLRLLHAYMLAQPGKILHFMGNELGQFLEWRYYEELDWTGLQRPYNQEYQYFIKELNHLGLTCPEFYQLDDQPQGILILDADDLEEGVLSFIRRGKREEDLTLVLLNFTPVDRFKRRVGLPIDGIYQVIMHSQAMAYGGKLKDFQKTYQTESIPYHHQAFSVELDIPGLSAIFIRLQSDPSKEGNSNKGGC